MDSVTAQSLVMIAIALFLVVLNGFFVAAEFAIVKVRSTRIQELVERGNVFAKMGQRAVQHLDAYLSATQLGITLASLGLGWIGEPAFAHLIEPLVVQWGGTESTAHAISVAIAFIVITILHIVFGELAPKSLAIMKPEGTTLAVAWPLHIFYKLFYPAIWVLNGMAGIILRAVGLQPAGEHENAHTQEEIRMILAESARGGSLKDSEVLLVERSFEFADTLAHAVMVPRVDIDYLSMEWDNAQILEVLQEHPHARYVVLEEEDLDRVVGFVHLKELVPQIAAGQINLRSILRELHIIPETHSIERLLRELQTRHSQIALVLDEYGGTAGIVTMEDLVEELVGELSDEMDFETPALQRFGDAFLIQGNAPLSDMSRLLGEEMDSTHYDTLAGWVMEKLEHVPQEGECVESDKYIFCVRKMDGPRVVEIEARPKTSETPPLTPEKNGKS